LIAAQQEQLAAEDDSPWPATPDSDKVGHPSCERGVGYLEAMNSCPSSSGSCAVHSIRAYDSLSGRAVAEHELELEDL